MLNSQKPFLKGYQQSAFGDRLKFKLFVQDIYLLLQANHLFLQLELKIKQIEKDTKNFSGQSGRDSVENYENGKRNGHFDGGHFFGSRS